MAVIFDIKKFDNELILRTSSFRAEKGSMLNSGIFSRELSAMFLSAGLSVLYLILIYLLSAVTLLHYIIAAAICLISFPLLRTYVFRESFLETKIDREKERISITSTGVFGKTIIKQRNELKEIVMGHIKITPDNPDAVAFVEKIALQHGTVIPGFGQTEQYYPIKLSFNDMEIDIFSSNDREESKQVLNELKSFINLP